MEIKEIIKDSVYDIANIITEYEELGKQIVGETILAVLATKTNDLVFTTYDINLKDAIIARVVDSIRNHWDFSNV